MDNLIKSLVLRFIRGAVAGFISTAVLVVPGQIGTYTEIGQWLNSLAIAGIVGAITGGLLTLDKYIRTELSNNE